MIIDITIKKRHHKKVNTTNANDNCILEFDYASRKKTNSAIVTVVVEKHICGADGWIELVGFGLGWKIYVDMGGDLGHKTYLGEQLKLLQKELQSKIIQRTPGMYCSYLSYEYFGRKS